MEIQYNKNSWPEGPWQNEPDVERWSDVASGLRCKIWRNQLGAWCGYAGVVPSSPLYEKDRNSQKLEDICVHGGLTFSGKHEEEGDIWFFGFDCCHAGDFIPAINLDLKQSVHYWDIDKVKDEVTKLARQLIEIS